ncbi:MAG: hypothetical protein FWC27_10560 [Firmicutes bacterium]|nr:hypothetical protein [Bacillota bacterium]
MYRLGVIEESLETPDTLERLRPLYFSQRLEEVPDDPSPIWHTNEYHVPDGQLVDLLPVLERQVKPTWYIHAFNDEELIVILRGKSFCISLQRDDTWDAMIAYGQSVQVETRYLENIQLTV